MTLVTIACLCDDLYRNPPGKQGMASLEVVNGGELAGN